MANTLIGTGIVVEGDIQTDEDIEILGIVRGKVDAKGSLVVEAGAQVEADLVGGRMSLAGAITGNIHSSDRVDLREGAKVVGNVKASRVTIADGAQFKGNVDMDL